MGHGAPLEHRVLDLSPSIDIPLLWSTKETEDRRLWKIDLQGSGAQGNPIRRRRGLGDPTPAKIWTLGGRGRDAPPTEFWESNPLNPPYQGDLGGSLFVLSAQSAQSVLIRDSDNWDVVMPIVGSRFACPRGLGDPTPAKMCTLGCPPPCSLCMVGAVSNCADVVRLETAPTGFGEKI